MDSTRVDLLFRASHASRLSNRYDDAQRLLETARDLVEEETEPLVLSRLLSEWCEVTWEATGPATSCVPERYEALRLTEAFPDSIERVSALSGLASAEAWDSDLVSARTHADQALAAARRNGSDLALAQALNTWGWIAQFGIDRIEPSEAKAAIEEALRLARGCGDAKEVVSGTIWLMNLLYGDLDLSQAAESGQRAVKEAIRLGDLHWCYFVAFMTADVMILLGRFEDARELLREALAVRCVGVPGAASRLAAGTLAMRTGELETARSHLDRAREVVEPDFRGLHERLSEAVAELRIAEGDPTGALEWIRSRAIEVDGSVEEKVLVCLARTLAEVAQLARDSGDVQGERRAVEELEQWTVPRRGTTPDLGNPEERDKLFRLVIAAETARCRNDPEEMDYWERVLGVCRSTSNRWEEACALRRLAEAAIRRNASHQFLAATLRRLHELAVFMGAHPLREQAERLARVARVDLNMPLDIPAQVAIPTGEDLPGGGLTTREREILGHLVAGRTNTEIAASLVISPKTVSVHVSNILRKTGSRSRVEAAARVLRQS